MSAQKRVATLTGHLQNPSPLAKAECKCEGNNNKNCDNNNNCGVKTCPYAAPKKPVRVLVTGAAGNIAYSIVYMIAQGQMLGCNQPIEMVLLDIPDMVKSMQGLVMELQDCAYPLLTKITATADYAVAFKDVEVAMLIGARPRGPGMQRKDLLQANATIFSGQGKALNQYANRNVKVLVVGNPANTNALIAMANAPNIPKSAFTAMTRLDQNRAVAALADRLRVTVPQVHNVVIWGNHSSTQYPDVNQAVVTDYPKAGFATPLRSAVNDNEFLNGAFIKLVQERGAAIIAARTKSSAASAAQAAVDHVRDWVLGTAKGEVVSMAVPSDGSYGVPEGLIYSFPVTCANGAYTIVKGLQLDEFSKKKLDLTTAELQEEKKQALGQ
jgi:malate dehydrogenase